ncbi:hypothetical protein Tco_0003976 [Tanacetum coccineum]
MCSWVLRKGTPSMIRPSLFTNRSKMIKVVCHFVRLGRGDEGGGDGDGGGGAAVEAAMAVVVAAVWRLGDEGDDDVAWRRLLPQ